MVFSPLPSPSRWCCFPPSLLRVLLSSRGWCCVPSPINQPTIEPKKHTTQNKPQTTNTGHGHGHGHDSDDSDNNDNNDNSETTTLTTTTTTTDDININNTHNTTTHTTKTTHNRCDAKAGFWDDAVRGSSPLQAALRRLVADELTQHTDNQEACTVLFDVESFCDSISLSLVARAGLKVAYTQFYWVWHYSHTQGFVSSLQGAAVSARESSSAMEWQRDALKATTLRDWRSTTSCRSRTSCIHPPRLRSGWMIWHSERKLRRGGQHDG